MAPDTLLHHYVAFFTMLAFSFCHSEETPGAPLRPYNETPVSYKLKCTLTGSIKLGAAINLTAALPDSHPELNITKCQWTSPAGEIFPQGNDYQTSDPGIATNN